MLKISNIFLPSRAQYAEYESILPPLKKICWLQDGVAAEDCEVTSIHPAWPLYIRPAIVLSNAMPEGSVFDFAGCAWTVCSSISHTSLAICNSTIAKRRFDALSLIWETSELKTWLNEWLEYVVYGLDDVILEKERE